MPKIAIRMGQKRPTQPARPRFEARFVNGVHTIFDTVNFGHGNPLGTRKEADRVAAELNSGKRRWTA